MIGEITGWIDADVYFDEAPDLFSLSRPRPCPRRKADDFNVELIQVHIARIKSILEDLQDVLDSYFYLISWKNPALTGLSLMLFVSICLRFNAEYMGR